MSALMESVRLLRRDKDGKFELYQYTPSLAAAIIFIILFVATTGFHIFQASKRRTYAFIPLIIGGIFEIIGYITRAMGHNNKTSMALYITSTVTLLVAPALFAASIYMVLGRVMIFSNGQSLSPIRPSFLTKIFVCGDVFSFLIQCLGTFYIQITPLVLCLVFSVTRQTRKTITMLTNVGGGMIASSKTQNLGKNIILIGLALQIIFFGIFLVCSLVFQKRARNSSVTTSPALWQKYIYTLYASGIFILVRSVFRMIEFGAGRSSILQTNEAFLYIFDAVLMVGAMVCFNIVHPGEIIGRDARGGGDVMMTSGDESSFRPMK